ncbi:hypothetical protein GHT06_021058 [Daphnia sinensis]|uniref:Uncharacterized protein n=1 Tax=Daphnia sinensis TaxID=1820382 RepID=A0AAD5KZ03_9CRUS|nr:hypothetical protein GHT06_021058 [Daphnia sinensis]
MLPSGKTSHLQLDSSQPYGDDSGLYFVVCGGTHASIFSSSNMVFLVCMIHPAGIIYDEEDAISLQLPRQTPIQ